MREIYNYDCKWEAYALSWSARRDRPFRLAVGSFTLEYANKVEIVTLEDPSVGLVRRCSFDHPYPPTKLMWLPDPEPTRRDVLATTGDYLRLWDVTPAAPVAAPGTDGASAEAQAGNFSVKMRTCLNNNKKTDFCAPLTSFDWNIDDPRLIGTASIDTTVSVWDIEAGCATTQLIAHDKEVFDIAFSRGADTFASVGGDGSLRLFDLRTLEHSTIVYESVDLQPLIRVAWNRVDPNYVAVVLLEQPSLLIVDVRAPGVPVAVLANHASAINAAQWAPHSSVHVCSAAEDAQALIWDLAALPRPVEDPILAYTASAEINGLSWSALQNDWIAIVFGQELQILRV